MEFRNYRGVWILRGLMWRCHPAFNQDPLSCPVGYKNHLRSCDLHSDTDSLLVTSHKAPWGPRMEVGLRGL